MLDTVIHMGLIPYNASKSQRGLVQVLAIDEALPTHTLGGLND